jgi:S-formylglutathione hydrolase
MMQKLSETKCFEGIITKYSHNSRTTNCEMRFNVFLPNAASKPFPALYFLSGLTCTEDNFFQKAGAFRGAAKHGLALVAPDTSYRGVDLPGDGDAWDFGKGAGFYLDATMEPWKKHANMYSYVVHELAELIKMGIPEIDSSRASISGHSMGGHGALTIALTNPGRFKSVSAFSPIVNPTQVPWGIKAFSNYLGGSSAQENPEWNKYDACELVKTYEGPPLDILIDQGTADTFLERELKPERFKEACQGNVSLELRMQQGYDHSYYFIQTFVESHLDFHAKHLEASTF